jgi:hypothetical protein
VEKLRRILLDDELGICADLEAEMHAMVDSYQDEWKLAVEDPKLRSQFRQFVNTVSITSLAYLTPSLSDSPILNRSPSEDSSEPPTGRATFRRKSLGPLPCRRQRRTGSGFLLHVQRISQPARWRLPL